MLARIPSGIVLCWLQTYLLPLLDSLPARFLAGIMIKILIHILNRVPVPTSRSQLVSLYMSAARLGTLDADGCRPPLPTLLIAISFAL